MTSLPRTIVLDTNVWLDVLLPYRPGNTIAKAFVSRAQAQGITLMYPVHAVSDVFYLSFVGTKTQLRQVYEGSDELIAAAARTCAWENVNDMREMATAVGADESDVWLACASEYLHNDVEDNLVLAAARRSKADCLVTNDRGLLEHASLACVAAVSVEDMLRLLTLS